MSEEMTEDERLAAALRSERDYETNIYRTRAYMGTAGTLGQGLLNYLKNAPLNYSDPARDKYYKSLQTLDPTEEDRRERAVEAAAGQATQRAREVGRQISGRLAADPTKAAAALQAAGKYETDVAQKARMDAETQAMTDRAAERKFKAEEASRIESDKLAEKQADETAKRERTFGLLETGLQAGMQLYGATRPQTKEAQLESKAIRTGKRAKRLDTRLSDKTMGTEFEGFSAEQIQMAKPGGRLEGLAKRRAGAIDSAKAAETDLATYRAANLAKQRERLRALYGEDFASNF